MHQRSKPALYLLLAQILPNLTAQLRPRVSPEAFFDESDHCVLSCVLTPPVRRDLDRFVHKV